MRLTLVSLMMMPLAIGCGGDDRRTPKATTNQHGSADSADDGSDTPIVDTDSDGVEATLDCDDGDPQLGAIKDDNDCDGVVAAADCDDTSADLGSVWDDGDCDGIAEAQDCNDNDPNSTAVANDADCDGAVTAEDCNDADAASTTVATDADCDGTVTVEDCDDTNPASTTVATDADCDGVPAADDCDDADPVSTTVAIDADCDTILTAADCDDADPTSTRIADDTDCDGVVAVEDCDDGDPMSTTIAGDADCDGVPRIVDCNDADPLFGSVWSDLDCDGVLTADDCDDADPTTADDMDCDGVATADDCDDTDPSTVDDMDCDGVSSAADCDDADPESTTIETDGDCDGAELGIDCDDDDPASTTIADDVDCDGVLSADDCDDSDPTTVDDMDCDGVSSDEDADDDDPTVSNIQNTIVDQKVDIIFFVDQSASMADKAAQMAGLYQSFVCAVEDVTPDWQMILIGRRGSPECGWGGILSPDRPDASETFETGATSGFGPSHEAGLEWANLAVEASEIGGCNEGFVRDDAVLYVVALTDEPDGSTGGYMPQVEQLIDAKGDPSQVVISAIAGDYPWGCGTASPGLGYYQAVQETGGLYRSICGGWGSVQSLQELGHAWRQTALYLDRTPDLDSLSVSVDGTVVSEGWTYEAEPPRVRFDSEPTVGGACGSTDIYDCDLDCVPAGVRSDEGNSECDSGCGISASDADAKRANLHCEAFGFDGGDCDVAIGGPCGDGYVVDCALQCVPETGLHYWVHSVERYRGDGVCDSDISSRRVVLDCEAFDFDGGDCVDAAPDPLGIPSFDECEALASDAAGGGDAAADTADPSLDAECMSMPHFRSSIPFSWWAPSTRCPDYGEPEEVVAEDAGESCEHTDDEGGVTDCSGDCVSAAIASEWTGDGTCDGAAELDGFHLDCAPFGFDGGDCTASADSTPSCTDMDDLTHVIASEACCECGGGRMVYTDPTDECEDTHGEAQDKYGRQCDSYTYDPSLCGENNDADFNSLSMCCACGGGSTSPVDGDICFAGEWEGADTTPLAPGSEVTIRYRAEGPE